MTPPRQPHDRKVTRQMYLLPCNYLRHRGGGAIPNPPGKRWTIERFSKSHQPSRLALATQRSDRPAKTLAISAAAITSLG